MDQIVFILPSNKTGGAERVIIKLANYASSNKVGVKIILLSKNKHFYKIHENVKIIEPDFESGKGLEKVVYGYLLFRWIRRKLCLSESNLVVTFGGKYNAFILLASLGLGKKVFVSDRSRPGISYGRFTDLLNKRMYRRAQGIVAQTQKSKEVAYKNTNHKNIRVIPNPFNQINIDELDIEKKERIILNVGRFIASKHQDWLVDYFLQINNTTWKLCFLGDGQHQVAVKEKSRRSTLADDIKFEGNRPDLDTWYQKSSVFAFTSTSEGFPNALGEAMAHGCACISFDCVAGPSELIDDGVNGFLIPEGNHELYVRRLKQLMDDEQLRIRFGKNAVEKMKQFSIDKIAKQYLDFILES